MSLFGYVLALAARHKQKVTVLDYGGNLATTIGSPGRSVPGVELEYHCKELPRWPKQADNALRPSPGTPTMPVWPGHMT